MDIYISALYRYGQKRQIVIGCVLCLMVFATIASGRSISITPLTSKIVIDGKIDKAWKPIPWHGGFLEYNNVREQKANVQTRFKIAYDKSFLYLLVRANEPRIKRIRVSEKKRDHRIWLDDCIEIFIDPAGTGESFYQIVVNSKGTLFDSRWIHGVSEKAWNPDIKAISKVRKNYWIIELAIPFCEMEIPAEENARFRMNIARERHAGGQNEVTSYAHASGSLPRVENFVSTSLQAKQLPQSRWDVILAGGEVHRRNGKYYYLGQLSVRQQGGEKSSKIAFLWKVLHDVGKTINEEFVWYVRPDGFKSRRIEVPLRKRGKHTLELLVEIYSRDKNGPCLYKKVFFEDVNIEPLTIRLVRPGYRNSIYASQTLKQIELEAVLLQRRPNMTLDISLRDTRKTVIASKTMTIRTHKSVIPVTLPIPENLAAGTYRIHTVLKDGKGKELAQTEMPLKKFPSPEGNEVRIDENNALRVNGKPFLPIGYFSLPRDKEGKLSQLTKEGVNSYIEYSSSWFGHDNERTKHWLDTFHRQGIKVILYPFPSVAIRKRKRAQKRSDSFTADDISAIRAYVDRWRKHPAVLAWYMADEPEGCLTDPKNFEDLYQLLREADPYHPCIMLNNTIRGIHTYSGGEDILMPDPYPLFLIDGHAARGIDRVTDFLQAIAEHPGKPAWLVPQVFNYGDYGQKNNRQPTFIELRNMFFQGVAANAKGFESFTYGAVKVYPELKIGMPAVTRELRSLQDAILARPNDDAVRVKTNPPKANIVYTLRNVGNDVYLFVVNNETKDMGIDVKCAETGD